MFADTNTNTDADAASQVPKKIKRRLWTGAVGFAASDSGSL